MRYDEANPPAIMDIEASGFGASSYPIEVGYIDSLGNRYCSLIRPLSGWQHWCLSAQDTHGIQRDTLLQFGQPPEAVAQELNRVFAGQTIYSDCWVADHPWLLKLFHESGIKAQFRLSPIEITMNEHQISIWDETYQQVTAQSDSPRHRASSDALVIQKTWISSYLNSR